MHTDCSSAWLAAHDLLRPAVRGSCGVYEGASESFSESHGTRCYGYLQPTTYFTLGRILLMRHARHLGPLMQGARACTAMLNMPADVGVMVQACGDADRLQLHVSLPVCAWVWKSSRQRGTCLQRFFVCVMMNGGELWSGSVSAEHTQGV